VGIKEKLDEIHHLVDENEEYEIYVNLNIIENLLKCYDQF